MEKPNIKKNKTSILALMVPLVIGGVIGAFCGVYLAELVPDGLSFFENIVIYLAFIIAIVFTVLFSVILHEAGHLLFGLLSGYKFCSFMIFGIDLIKQDGKLRIKRYSLPGAGGQCLMCPPEYNDNSFPVMLYNLGGIIANAVVALVFGATVLLFDLGLVPKLILGGAALVNLVFALVNGIPISAVIENDGYNTVMLKNNPKARKAFWLQLKYHELLAQGLRIKDLPEEMLFRPTDEELASNSLIAFMANFMCERLVDEHRFEEAYSLSEEFLAKENKIIQLNRVIMVSDMIFAELILENRGEVLEGLLTKDQKRIMAQLKAMPCVLRTEYAYALLGQGDVSKAEKIKSKFDKVQKSYPYKGEIESAKELFAIVDETKAIRDAEFNKN